MQPDFQSNLSEYTVGELARRLRGLVEQSFQHVRVRGEISNCKRAASGHCYFTLHDQDAVLQAICWRSKLGLLETLPQDGLEVVVAGRLTTYAQRSSYQIIVEVLKPAGIGALLKLLEERKRKLAQEGLFDVQRKKQLPFLARRIIVMTSPSGAVIRDLIHRLSERLPVELWVLPIPVQGSEASSKIVDAFCRLKKLAPADAPDLVIIARGGGSLEDLWAFNEEHTVRAAADCPWPLISAIGHETDHSLIDLVADHRAPTPSAAGEMAVPVLRELKAVLAGLSARLEQAPLRMIKSLHRLVEAQARGLPNPELLYSRTVQRLDEQTMRLARLIHHRLELLARKRTHLRLQLPSAILGAHNIQLSALHKRLEQAIKRVLHTHHLELEAKARLLENLSHRAILARGFALVHDQADRLLTTPAQLGRHGLARLEFASGQIWIKPVYDVRNPAKPKAGKLMDSSNGNLFED